MTEPPLTDAQIQSFVRDGFVRLDHAFPREVADEAVAILWREIGWSSNDPSTWTRPVVRLGMYTGAPFVAAANTPRMHAAFDQLVGAGRWLPCGSMGTFRVAFPLPDDPGDAGWHVDVSFGFEDPDFFAWRANVVSKGRALLMLLLFSDVGEDDAPTRLRVGSHLDVARRLAPAGDEGLSLRELAANGFEDLMGHAEAQATGEAGTAYLCHPFLVHSAQVHRGTRPRFLAQPPLLPRQPLDPFRDDGLASPVEATIRLALQ